MAIVLAFQKLRHYLLERHFMDQRLLGHNQQKWLIKILIYDLEIIYKPRCENKVVDALFRNPRFFEKELLAFLIVSLLKTKELQQEVNVTPLFENVPLTVIIPKRCVMYK